MNTIIKVRLILRNDTQVLLLRQTDENGGKLTLPGGTVEAMEFAQKTLIRECKEELGIKISKKDLVVAHILHKKKFNEDRVTIYFTTNIWKKKIKCKEKKKFCETTWISMDQLPQETSSTVAHVLAKVKAGKQYSHLDVTATQLRKLKDQPLRVVHKAATQSGSLAVF